MKASISEHKQNFFNPLFLEKSHFWHNSGTVAPITIPTNFLLSRYTAGFISDNNSERIFSEVKHLPNITLLTARYSILCTRRLQPSRDDCAVLVQGFFSVLVMTEESGVVKL